jgi:hypothetical protein
LNGKNLVGKAIASLKAGQIVLLVSLGVIYPLSHIISYQFAVFLGVRYGWAIASLTVVQILTVRFLDKLD